MDIKGKVELAIQNLVDFSQQYQPAVFSTSLSAEDMVLLDLIDLAAIDVGVFTLDTGRCRLKHTTSCLKRKRDTSDQFRFYSQIRRKWKHFRFNTGLIVFMIQRSAVNSAAIYGKYNRYAVR